MSLPSLVNVPSVQLGMGLTVSNQPLAEEANFLMLIINVNAQMELTSRMDIVKVLVVKVDKFSMGKLVFVIQALIGMELFVFSVLMGKFGMLTQCLADAKLALYGMAISVKKVLHALEEEFIIKITNNVFAPIKISGMVQLACQNQIVAADKNGTERL